jgi:beta-1,2-mannobiose phosphorylase / 1,2-beta-oligomannan phosphorylase
MRMKPKRDSKPRKIDISRESIWISYAPCHAANKDQRRLCEFRSHHRLASPVAPWEHLKIGGGTPPVLTQHGWLTFYHGVYKSGESTLNAHRLRYSAGVLLLSEERPRHIRYRSTSPVLEPELPAQQTGLVANVVFPTAVDPRPNLEESDCIDVYYGMADSRIGVARTKVPRELPPQASAIADQQS